MKTSALKGSEGNLVSVKNIKSKIIVKSSSLLLAALFTYAAFNKLIIYKTFIAQLQESPITNGFENLLAWLIPAIELIIAVMLILPQKRVIGLWGSLILMFAFTVYVFALPTFFSRDDLPCSCGGIISHLDWIQHFWFNLGFTCLAALGIMFSSPKSRNN